jgi:hypothetical protein
MIDAGAALEVPLEASGRAPDVREEDARLNRVRWQRSFRSNFEADFTPLAE